MQKENEIIIVIERFQNGDKQALAELYTFYKDSLYRFIYRYSNNESLSIDVVQDTFEKLQRTNSYQKEKGSFKTYLFQIAYHTMLTKLKRQKLFEKWLPFLAEKSQNVSLELEEKLTIREAIQTLPDDLKAIILLTYYHDLPQKEIAYILNIPIGTVKSKLHRALKKLKIKLEGMEQ